MNYSSPGAEIVSVKMSGDSVFHNNDEIVHDNEIFFAGKYQAGTASNYTHIQLMNPAGSGITLLIDKIAWVIATTFWLDHAFYDTELTTDDGAGAARSKTGGAALAHLRSQQNLSELGTTYRQARNASIQTWVETVYTMPIEILDGDGYMLHNSNTNSFLAAYFEWREV